MQSTGSALRLQRRMMPASPRPAAALPRSHGCCRADRRAHQLSERINIETPGGRRRPSPSVHIQTALQQTRALRYWLWRPAPECCVCAGADCPPVRRRAAVPPVLCCHRQRAAPAAGPPWPSLGRADGGGAHAGHAARAAGRHVQPCRAAAVAGAPGRSQAGGCRRFGRLLRALPARPGEGLPALRSHHHWRSAPPLHGAGRLPCHPKQRVAAGQAGQHTQLRGSARRAWAAGTARLRPSVRWCQRAVSWRGSDTWSHVPGQGMLPTPCAVLQGPSDGVREQARALWEGGRCLGQLAFLRAPCWEALMGSLAAPLLAACGLGSRPSGGRRLPPQAAAAAAASLVAGALCCTPCTEAQAI